VHTTIVISAVFQEVKICSKVNHPRLNDEASDPLIPPGSKGLHLKMVTYSCFHHLFQETFLVVIADMQLVVSPQLHQLIILGQGNTYFAFLHTG